MPFRLPRLRLGRDNIVYFFCILLRNPHSQSPFREGVICTSKDKNPVVYLLAPKRKNPVRDLISVGMYGTKPQSPWGLHVNTNKVYFPLPKLGLGRGNHYSLHYSHTFIKFVHEQRTKYRKY